MENFADQNFFQQQIWEYVYSMVEGIQFDKTNYLNENWLFIEKYFNIIEKIIFKDESKMRQFINGFMTKFIENNLVRIDVHNRINLKNLFNRIFNFEEKVKIVFQKEQVNIKREVRGG